MRTPRKIADQYRAIVSSIGFYPAIIITLFMLFAMVLANIEYQSWVMRIKQAWPVLFVTDVDTAKTLLGILAGGLISLTVFSFSMVMVVLNNAAATLSPRVLPGLISIKAHQYVLGMYLGSIVFTLLTLMNIHTEGETLQTPALGTFFALAIGIYNLVLFVFFIHSISRSIQVDSVLNTLFAQTNKQLQNLIAYQDPRIAAAVPNYCDWYRLKSPRAGYFKGVHTQQLCKLLAQHELRMVTEVEPGFFCVEGFPYLALDRDISADEELCEQIHKCSVFYIEEYIGDHYSYGLRQIAEIAIKALSPGINDPGTAVKAIDMLSILTIARLHVADHNYTLLNTEQQQSPLLWFYEPSLASLLEENFDPIRHYGCNDTTVLVNLIEALKNILFVCEHNREYTQALYRYVQATVYDAEHCIDNPYERERINRMLTRMNEVANKRGDDIHFSLSDKDAEPRVTLHN
ncbi:DUF2254 domain-containing protein [Pseudoalteromonas sp. T1lg22]|uniref:DUF2254 domain-containing protein n=1 Tax=Pseudoalteromonas sp. T1lg22 TaxID=2077096 RepID=UPI000CF69A75|nr:DUF2254 domain-containing protein [Pseudoalteromonas sp. T1lg22]